MFFKHISYDYEHKQRFDAIIANWQPSSDVWSFKYAKYALPGFGSLTAFWTTMYLRKVIKMGKGGIMATLAVPLYGTVFCGFAHTLFVEYPLIAGREHCATCTSARSTALQAIFGSVVPTFISCVTLIYVAGSSNAYAFHDKMFTSWSAIKANGSLILKLFQQRRRDRIVVALFLLNAIAGFIVAELQYESMYKVASRLHREGKSFIMSADDWDPMRGIKL